MKHQPWFCEACQATGDVDYEDHAGVMEVFYAVKDQHRANSPGCKQPHKVRVVNEQWYIDRGTTFEAEVAAGRVEGYPTLAAKG